MSKIKRLYIADIFIGLCMVGVVFTLSTFAFDVGVIKGEAQKMNELTALYERRDEWLQMNTSPVFVSFWFSNREFCQSVGIDSYKSFLELYENQPEINVLHLHNKFQQESYLVR